MELKPTGPCKREREREEGEKIGTLAYLVGVGIYISFQLIQLLDLSDLPAWPPMALPR